MATKNIAEQREILVRHTQINKSLLKGFRMPHLLQNQKFFYIDILENFYDFTYDSSVVIKPTMKKSTFNQWPHSLHFEPNYECSYCRNNNNKSIGRLWEVPLTYFDINGNFNKIIYSIRVVYGFCNF